MERQGKNYRRFYAAFNKLPHAGSPEEDKEATVESFTNGRTSHLSEMKGREYQEMCRTLEGRLGFYDVRKKKRSVCLKLMQQAGIDTTDWARINEFCRNARIAGKEFALLGIGELEALARKLRAINHNGGLKSKEPNKEPQVTIINYGTARQQTTGGGC